MTDVKNEIKKVVGTAPEALDTLQEIAQALGNDPNKINTILSQLGLKASQKDLDTFKEKAITELKFNNNKITYKENGISKEIDLSSYVNQSKEQIETIVENKGNTLYEQKDNTIVKNLAYDSANKKITYKMNNVNKEIEFSNLKGEAGVGLDFDWQGTKLGVKKSTETNYNYVDLKGQQGNVGNKGTDGVSISNISTVGTKLVIDTTDGQHKELNVPTVKGDKGDKISEAERLADLQKLWNENLKFLTIEEYNALAQKDPNIIYVLIRSA